MGIKNKKDTTNKPASEQEPEKQIIKEHTRALRSHLLWLAGSFVVAAIVGFEFKEVIQGLLTLQLADLSLMNLASADDLKSTIVVSLFTGAVVAIPLIAYHAYRFLEPILERGNSYAARLLLGSGVLSITAIAYTFMVTVPLALHGMAAYGQDATMAHVTTQSFLLFVIINSLVVVTLFQLPLAIIFINSVRPISQKARQRLQQIILPLIAVAAIISTPFTTVNRGVAGIVLIILPAVMLFEVSMMWAKAHAKSKEATIRPYVEDEVPLYDHAALQKSEPQPERVPVIAPVVATPIATATEGSLFDALDEILQDDDTLSSPTFSQHELPPSWDGMADEIVVPASPTVSKAVQQPAYQQQIVTTKSMIAPAYRSVSSFDVAQSRSARPVAQPTTGRVATVTPMTKAISVQEVAAPVPRSRRAPEQTIPFRMSSARLRERSIEGFLTPAH